ncbi:DNA replication/repair protein RecF [candidate division KSB1 bacterium]|nr:DNA replication/repair protein RecF [candidate division KSB1 bacterium]RQW02435.1 MAG: DNA replication/repair protein RecF [candidate division KSB1 bacterium]
MFLNRLEIQKFRNLAPALYEPRPHRNYIFGDNAQGKTNLIEAIYLLCLAKSFRTREDSDLVPFSDESYFIEGDFLSDEQIPHHVGIMFDVQQGKQIKVDGKKLGQFSKLVGLFPVIVLSVNDYEITSGPPAQRRRFFNVLLSQSSRRYLDDLKQYDQVLKQRNTILAGAANDSMLGVWDDQLVQSGVRLMMARSNMVEELNHYLADFYAAITGARWTFRIAYSPNVGFRSPDEAEGHFKAGMRRASLKEKRQGRTLVGPHRDEFLFYISDNELRKFGSRGEHKSALVSLKAAEARVLYKRTENHPMLLLDDLYAELDKQRSQRVLDLFDPASQIFVTGTSLDAEMIESSAHLKEQMIFENGQMKRGKWDVHPGI